MQPTVRPQRVAILALPEVTASTLFGMHDLFSAAGRDFGFITRGVPGESRMTPCIAARDAVPFLAANQVWVTPHAAYAELPIPDIVCIPDFFVDPGANVAGNYAREAAWLQQVHAQGAVIASACSGAVLLGEAGLLTNCEATIHWGYGKTLTDHYPGIALRMSQPLVVTGAGHRIVMAGGGTSWQDLALYLIARYVGLKEAIEVAKVYMLQWHELGQQPFASLMSLRQTDDPLINQCQQWLAGNFRRPSPVTGMVAISGLSERTFARRFGKATGLTPLDYVHAVRLEEAKRLLEEGGESVESIALQVGYEDATFFGRLFRRRVGLTPARYRARFGPLRQAL